MVRPLPRMGEAIFLELRLLEIISILHQTTRSLNYTSFVIREQCTSYELRLFGAKAFPLNSTFFGVYHRTRIAGTILNCGKQFSKGVRKNGKSKNVLEVDVEKMVSYFLKKKILFKKDSFIILLKVITNITNIKQK